eukprot:scaffold6711_cov118-Isochrysis_galbana.AAC.7
MSAVLWSRLKSPSCAAASRWFPYWTPCSFSASGVASSTACSTGLSTLQQRRTSKALSSWSASASSVAKMVSAACCRMRDSATRFRWRSVCSSALSRCGTTSSELVISSSSTRRLSRCRSRGVPARAAAACRWWRSSSSSRARPLVPKSRSAGSVPWTTWSAR